MSTDNRQSFRLNARERDLIARYGYPFDDLQQQLQAAAGNKGTVVISIEPFYVERLTADLVYSARKLTDEDILEELEELVANVDSQLGLH